MNESGVYRDIELEGGGGNTKLGDLKLVSANGAAGGTMGETGESFIVDVL